MGKITAEKFIFDMEFARQVVIWENNGLLDLQLFYYHPTAHCQTRANGKVIYPKWQVLYELKGFLYLFAFRQIEQIGSLGQYRMSPLGNQITVVVFQPVQLAQASFLQKKSNVVKCFFDICNAEMAQSLIACKSAFKKYG